MDDGCSSLTGESVTSAARDTGLSWIASTSCLNWGHSVWSNASLTDVGAIRRPVGFGTVGSDDSTVGTASSVAVVAKSGRSAVGGCWYMSRSVPPSAHCGLKDLITVKS